MSKFTDFLLNRYTDGGAGLGNLDFSNIAKDLGTAGALYGIVNPNDSSGLASFFGTGGRQQPVGYTGGIPNYTATRELLPDAFAQTYTTPTGEVAPRRPGSAGRRYFTDTTFAQSTDEPLMGVTAEQLTAQNQAALDEQALFESILGSVEAQRIAGAATPAPTPTPAPAPAPAPTPTPAPAPDTTTAPAPAPAPDTTTAQMTADEILATYVDPTDGFSQEEQSTIANIIAAGDKNIDQIANLYSGVESVDVVEGLLRGGFQTPEQVAAMYPTLDEPMLIATLLDQGKTTPEEVADYYKDHPVYGGITPEQVIAAFQDLGGTRQFVQGGDINAYYLGGTTDGMADDVPATIDGTQPAALSDGEFVVPADVVSHLGNGNSDAGAKELYSMMDRVRTDRTGSPKQGRQIDPNKYLA